MVTPKGPMQVRGNPDRMFVDTSCRIAERKEHSHLNNVSVTVSGYADYTATDEHFVVVGGTLPMLLSGKGDAQEAIDRAGNVLVGFLLDKGIGPATEYLTRRGANVTVSRAPDKRQIGRRANVTARYDVALTR